MSYRDKSRSPRFALGAIGAGVLVTPVLLTVSALASPVGMLGHVVQVLGMTIGAAAGVLGASSAFWLVVNMADDDIDWGPRTCRACERNKALVAEAWDEVRELQEALVALK